MNGQRMSPPAKLSKVPVTVTEWAIRYSGFLRVMGTGSEAEETARLLAEDYRKADQGGLVMSRTVTYGPWKEARD